MQEATGAALVLLKRLAWMQLYQKWVALLHEKKDNKWHRRLLKGGKDVFTSLPTGFGKILVKHFTAASGRSIELVPSGSTGSKNLMGTFIHHSNFFFLSGPSLSNHFLSPPCLEKPALCYFFFNTPAACDTPEVHNLVMLCHYLHHLSLVRQATVLPSFMDRHTLNPNKPLGHQQATFSLFVSETNKSMDFHCRFCTDFPGCLLTPSVLPLLAQRLLFQIVIFFTSERKKQRLLQESEGAGRTNNFTEDFGSAQHEKI